MPIDFYWRCAHHPSCIENFFVQRLMCEHGCHATPLKSTDFGVHQPPQKSSMHPILNIL